MLKELPGGRAGYPGMVVGPRANHQEARRPMSYFNRAVILQVLSLAPTGIAVI